MTDTVCGAHDFHLQAVVGVYRVSTVKLSFPTNPWRELTCMLTGHEEALYETCVFANDKDKSSYVIAEYQNEQEATEGHQKIVRQFQSGKTLCCIDLFTKEEVIYHSLTKSSQ